MSAPAARDRFLVHAGAATTRRKIKKPRKVFERASIPAAMFRRTCPQCSSDRIEWPDAVEAASHGIDVEEMAGFFGMPKDRLDYWQCQDCDEAGAFAK